ncbi:hypothetical protein HanRHA438_Chr14g0656781 [Helianthus annuus]|nr:hypothetical protein HanRHA438_Chr14g0656781 [Helianthus annuus]
MVVKPLNTWGGRGLGLTPTRIKKKFTVQKKRWNGMDDYDGMKKRVFGWSMEWNYPFQKAFNSLKIIPSTPHVFFPFHPLFHHHQQHHNPPPSLQPTTTTTHH